MNDAAIITALVSIISILSGALVFITKRIYTDGVKDRELAREERGIMMKQLTDLTKSIDDLTNEIMLFSQNQIRKSTHI